MKAVARKRSVNWVRRSLGWLRTEWIAVHRSCTDSRRHFLKGYGIIELFDWDAEWSGLEFG